MSRDRRLSYAYVFFRPSPASTHSYIPYKFSFLPLFKDLELVQIETILFAGDDTFWVQDIPNILPQFESVITESRNTSKYKVFCYKDALFLYRNLNTEYIIQRT